MKEDGADIVQMAIERKEAPPALIRPHFDFIIVSSRHEQWLCLVEINPSYGAIVLFEPVYQGPHPIIPQLNGGRMQ